MASARPALTATAAAAAEKEKKERKGGGTFGAVAGAGAAAADTMQCDASFASEQTAVTAAADERLIEILMDC